MTLCLCLQKLNFRNLYADGFADGIYCVGWGVNGALDQWLSIGGNFAPDVHLVMSGDILGAGAPGT